MIQINEFRKTLKSVIETKINADCKFVLTFSMVNALNIHDEYAAIVHILRTQEMEWRQCNPRYKVALYLGIRDSEAESEVKGEITQWAKADILLNIAYDVVHAIYADDNMKILDVGSYTYHDEIEGVTTKDYLWTQLPLEIQWITKD